MILKDKTKTKCTRYCILICIFHIDKGPRCQNPVHSSDFISDLMEDASPAWTPCITHLCHKHIAYLLEKQCKWLRPNVAATPNLSI